MAWLLRYICVTSDVYTHLYRDMMIFLPETRYVFCYSMQLVRKPTVLLSQLDDPNESNVLDSHTSQKISSARLLAFPSYNNFSHERHSESTTTSTSDKKYTIELLQWSYITMGPIDESGYS